MGTKHVFILDNCLYHPDLPVNLLFTRCLAEKFIDESGNPDKETQIGSRYSTHVLTWPMGQFQKTFSTPVSSLPELLFDEGYHTFKSFYQHTDMTDTTTNAKVIPYDDKELIAFEDTDNAINMLFMLHKSILLKDAKGTPSEVTYLGSQLFDEVLPHKVRNKNGYEFLADGNLLSSMDTPDISNISVSIEQYAAELPKLTHEHLEQISNP
jgi:hypothetical protein